jgi:SWI/SNF-related matrix-associated actin-dependent regulator 1 of chromatin subfamily A
MPITPKTGSLFHAETQFLVSKGRAILGDDMGLGKTRQAIIAMQAAAPKGTILVVCPASLKLNWRREIRMVDTEAKVEVLGVGGGEESDPRWVIVNYDLLAKNAMRLNGIPWSGVILDEAHFIKNNSQRTSHCLKLLGVSNNARTPLIGPEQVYLLTGTPMTNRPRDLFNLLRCVGHPSARSFISFAQRYCDAYRNDYGWVTTGASNLDELNLLMKEVMLRRRKDEVLDLPEKIRSWIPVSVESAAARNAQTSFAQWFVASDASRPNDKDFLARLNKVRVALHKAKHRAVEERVRDVLATDRKMIVFTTFLEGLKKHKTTFAEQSVTISGADNAEQRMEAVDRFQNDPGVRLAVCNIIAGGVGITLTAATHVIFQDLDWVPANHLQAEDRAYRLGQAERVTVEYMLADGTLDIFIADLLETKLRVIGAAVESDEAPDASVLDELYAKLRSLGPSLLQETKAVQATGEIRDRLEKLATSAGVSRAADSSLLSTGVHEFTSSREPGKVYRVTFGRAGHLECTCDGFRWRGNCKHVREVRENSQG